MIQTLHRLLKSLTLRMVVPVVLVILLVWLGLYFFVLRAVSEFADQQIREALAANAKELYNICDDNFTELMQSGQMDNPRAVRIKKALTLGAIEDYLKRTSLNCRLYEEGHGELLARFASPALSLHLAGSHPVASFSIFQSEGKLHYFYHFNFKPWNWHLDLSKDTARYAPLINRVKRTYLLTGAFLLLGLTIILSVLERLLRNPLKRIIGAIREGRAPQYKGVYEFEFLSDNVASMMRSLKDRTACLERLYYLAMTNRGEVFFQAIARELSAEMGLHVVVVKIKGNGGKPQAVAFAGIAGNSRESEELAKALPCLEIAMGKQPIVIHRGAAARLSLAGCPKEFTAESYIGLPIFNREGETIGCVNLFGPEKDFNDWDLNLIKTAGQMVAGEFELMEKETEQEQIREQMFRAQKMESLGLLAGGVAHDFNNLLMGVLGRASLMSHAMDASQPHYEHVKAIEEYVVSASELTRQLLGFARGGKYEVKPADMNVIIAKSASMFGRTKKEITIHKSLEPNLWPVEVDQRQIEQVLLNLYVNSWHAMPGGGNLFIKTANLVLNEIEVKLHQLRPGRYIEISVTDDGVGMDEATRKRVFDPFFTTREMGRGSGLGLASAYGIIKNHDGMINVHSEKGRGTTFTICLPVTDKGISNAEKAQKEIVMGGTESILLIDDEEMITDVGKRMLDSIGYKVHVAGSGEQGVEFLQREVDNVHLVILDMIMPNMSGNEAFERLRTINPSLRILLSSGYSLDGQAQAILAKGCNGFIQKPFNLLELSKKVRQILDSA